MASTLHPPGQDISRPKGITRYRYVILVFMWLAVFLNYLDRATLSVVLDEVKAEIRRQLERKA